MTESRRVHRRLVAAFYIALVLGLAFYLRSIDWSELGGARLHGWWLLAASAVGMLARLWQVRIWITVLRNLGARDVRMDAHLTLVYAKSWLGRYIPGTAPWILGKIYFASRHGISKAKLAVGSLLEAGVQVAVLILLSVVALLIDERLRVIGPELVATSVALAAVCVVMLVPAVFNRVLGLAARLLRRGGALQNDRADLRTVTVAAVQYAFGALLAGIALFLLARAVYPSVQVDDLLFVVAASCLAGAASMVAVFAPAGIGVRESLLLVLLAAVMPAAIAAVVVLMVRVWGVAMDLLFVLAASIATRARTRHVEVGR